MKGPRILLFPIMLKTAIPVLGILLVLACKSTATVEKSPAYFSETLVLQPLTPHVYQHISYLQTQDFGKVACNGMLVIDKNEAIIFDTPADAATSQELINWVEKELKCSIKAVVPTHFHKDCLGGLDVFHAKNIPSYANSLTILLAEKQNYVLPKIDFETTLELQVGRKKVVLDFVGEGHTKDNIIGYFPTDNVLFGGCLVKELGAGKGNLEDANITSWPITMAALKGKYPEAKIVIPGHGKPGDKALLDFTETLFSTDYDN